MSQRDPCPDASYACSEGILVALERCKTRRRELAHRINNQFALMASILRLKASTARSPALRQDLQEAAEWVNAFALLNRLADSGANLGTMPMDVCFEALKDAMRPSFEARGIALAIDADDTALPLAKAEVLVLLAIELLTNALKHAFEGREGDGHRHRVTVTALRAGDGTYRLVVADNGSGLPEGVADGGTSTGLRLVHMLAKQIDARVMVECQRGTCFVFRVGIT